MGSKQGQGATAPGEYVLKGGRHKGKPLAKVAALDEKHVRWISTHAQSPEDRAGANAFLESAAAQGEASAGAAPADTGAAVEQPQTATAGGPQGLPPQAPIIPGGASELLVKTIPSGIPELGAAIAGAPPVTVGEPPQPAPIPGRAFPDLAPPRLFEGELAMTAMTHDEALADPLLNRIESDPSFRAALARRIARTGHPVAPTVSLEPPPAAPPLPQPGDLGAPLAPFAQHVQPAYVPQAQPPQGQRTPYQQAAIEAARNGGIAGIATQLNDEDRRRAAAGAPAHLRQMEKLPGYAEAAEAPQPSQPQPQQAGQQPAAGTYEAAAAPHAGGAPSAPPNVDAVPIMEVKPGSSVLTPWGTVRCGPGTRLYADDPLVRCTYQGRAFDEIHKFWISRDQESPTSPVQDPVVAQQLAVLGYTRYASVYGAGGPMVGAVSAAAPQQPTGVNAPRQFQPPAAQHTTDGFQAPPRFVAT